MLARANYLGLSFHVPGFNPFVGRAEGRVQGLDYFSSDRKIRLVKKDISHKQTGTLQAVV